MLPTTLLEFVVVVEFKVQDEIKHVAIFNYKIAVFGTLAEI